MSDLWVEASTNVEAEHLAQRMALAKVSVASLWPFLASASSPHEFEHRLALSYDTLADMVEPPLLASTVASLRDDYALLATPTAAPTAATPTPHTASPTAHTASTAPQQVNIPAVGMQIWHQGSRKWISVSSAAQETPHNMGFDQALFEEGPNTGQSNNYPQHPTGSDPQDPINGPDPENVIPPAESFPAQPQPWVGGPTWQQAPMNFTPPRHGSYQQPHLQQQQHPQQRVADANPNPVQQMQTGPLSYTDEGVETGTGANPYYFDQGNQGMTGQGFPPDVALPEPDERVQMYQDATPHAQLMGYEQGYVSTMMAAIQREADYHYIHEQAPGDWVITQKGSGKVLSHHDSEDKAQEAFRAMMWSKHSHLPTAPRTASMRHGGSQAQALQFFDPFTHTADAGSDAGNYLSGNPYLTAGDQPSPMKDIQPPASTQQGGAGAEAMPPMSAPGSGGAGGGGGMGPADPGGSDAAAKSLNTTSNANHQPRPLSPAVSLFGPQGLPAVTADEYRGRPTQYAPEGVSDEYDANTWDNAVRQAPRQTADQRMVNTPQRPREPIPTISSSDVRPAQNDEEMDDRDEDQERHEAARQAGYRSLSNRSRNNGQNGQPPLTSGKRQPNPQGGTTSTWLNSMINQSVSLALTAAHGSN